MYHTTLKTIIAYEMILTSLMDQIGICFYPRFPTLLKPNPPKSSAYGQDPCANSTTTRESSFYVWFAEARVRARVHNVQCMSTGVGRSKHTLLILARSAHYLRSPNLSFRARRVTRRPYLPRTIASSLGLHLCHRHDSVTRFEHSLRHK